MDSRLQLMRCTRCGSYGFPPGMYGCGSCGTGPQDLAGAPCPEAPRLLNWVSVHAELVPGLPVPCLVGEVELAPGVVEEALLDLGDTAPRVGMRLAASHAEGAGWLFRPAEQAA